MAVYIVDHTTSGAPQFGSQYPGAGSFIQIFDYLLVTLMGWSKPFVNSNNTIAVYRSPPGTHQRYLRIDDSSTSTNNLSNSKAIANSYERMSDLNTGYNKSPNIYLFRQQTNGEWYFHSNGKIFWFSWNAIYNVYYSSFMFGDFISYVQGDEYNTIIAGCTEGNNGYSNNYLQHISFINQNLWRDHYIIRPYTQIGSYPTAMKVSELPFTSSELMGKGLLPYPHLADNSLKICRMYLIESGNIIRGYIPGIWIPMHNLPLPHNSVFEGSNGNLAGRTFKTFRKYNQANTNEFEYFYETSDTWEI